MRNPPRLRLTRRSWIFWLGVLIGITLLIQPGFLHLFPNPGTDFESRIVYGSQRLSLAIGAGFAMGVLTALLSIFRTRDVGVPLWLAPIVVLPIWIGSSWAYTQLQGFSYNAPIDAYLYAAIAGLILLVLLTILPSAYRKDTVDLSDKAAPS